jgi:hypothetical protein
MGMKTWGWRIYYWVAKDAIVVGNHRGLVHLVEGYPKKPYFIRYVTASRMPKTLIEVGEL